MDASCTLVALTGGIGSGKSAAAELFRLRHATVFDADIVARELVQPGMPALAEIASVFGQQMLMPGGGLDRARMRRHIFADPHARRRLEAILHPRVRATLLDAVRACAAAYCVLVIPLLAEVRNDYDFVDRVLVIDASAEIQAKRLMLRDRCTVQDAATMIAAQAPRAARLAIADDVIDNDGDISLLEPAVERLHAAYLALVHRTQASA